MRKSGNLEKLHGKFGKLSIGKLNIFSGKKVFVTGHTGFKGSWLTAWLTNLGAQVKGYALAPESNEGVYQRIGGDSICESIIADIRDGEKLKNEIISFKPDFVFHLAAQPLVRLSYKNPTETFDVNVIGTANLLNAIRILENKCAVVVITTDKVYENHEWAYPYREIDALGGYDPYSASKACTEIVINSFRQSFFNPDEIENHQKYIASARAGNVIGGGDWSDDRIIPDIVKSLISKKNVIIRNPKAIRPWQFVLEPLYGYLILASSLIDNPIKFSGAYNFGPLPNDFLSVEQLVKQAINIWGSGEYKIQTFNNQPHEAGTLKLDISKAYDDLIWQPKLNSLEAIRWTIDWYRQNIGQIKYYTFDQISRYQNL